MPLVWDALLRLFVAFVSKPYTVRVMIVWFPFLHSLFHFSFACSKFSVT